MTRSLLLGLGMLAAGAATFEAQDLPAARQKITASCGASPAIVVKWDDFDKDVDARSGLIEGGLAFLTDAFAVICKDAALKAEVGRQISKIALTQAYGAADPVVYLVRGTLHVEYLWTKGQPAPDTNYVRAEVVSRLRGEEPEAP